MTVRAAGLILYRGVRPYEYLLLKANYHPFHWSPPKGHHNKNETDLQAAHRETEEETGYTPEDYVVNKFFTRKQEYIAHGRNKTVIYFIAKLKNREKDPVLSKEHRAFKWVTLDEACELFNHEEMEDLYHAADLHLACDLPTEEKCTSEIDFSKLPAGSDEEEKGTQEEEEIIPETTILEDTRK